MTSVFCCSAPRSCLTSPELHAPKKSIYSPRNSLSFTYSSSWRLPQLRAVRTGGETTDSDAAAVLRKPLTRSLDSNGFDGSLEKDSSLINAGEVEERREVVEEKEEEEEEEREIATSSRWVDWEDQILEDTAPLVGFARMILHSGKYDDGDKLSPEHEKKIIDKFLSYHPEVEKKIGSGIDFITIGLHPEFQTSRCLFIVRKDGVAVDFSYWKCIKGFIRKNYPLYADSFILKHFWRRKSNN